MFSATDPLAGSVPGPRATAAHQGPAPSDLAPRRDGPRRAGTAKALGGRRAVTGACDQQVIYSGERAVRDEDEAVSRASRLRRRCRLGPER